MNRNRQSGKVRAGRALLLTAVVICACSLIFSGLVFGQSARRSLPERGVESGQRGGGTLISRAPTEVRLHSFAAERSETEVWLKWQTGYELDNLGYNVYREQDGERVQLNPALIAGSALQAGQGIRLRAGFAYAWRDPLSDRKPLPEESYWLESIDLDGRSSWHGPVQAVRAARNAPAPLASRLLSDLSVESARTLQREWPADALRVDDGVRESLSKPPISAAGKGSTELEQQWALAAQPAVKLLVKREGWQRVTRAELLAAGLDPSAVLANLQLYLTGVEQAMRVDADGSIEFYGRPLDALSTDTRVYWLVAGATPGKRVSVSSAGPFDPTVQASGFANVVERKDRVIRFPALLNGASENFFGPVVSATPARQTLQVNGLDQLSAEPARLEVGVQGLTFQQHQVRVQVNGTDVGFINFSGRQSATQQFTLSPFQLREFKNEVRLTGTAPGADSSLVGYVRLSYPRRYEAVSNRLLCSVAAGQPVRLSNFSNPNIRVLDITDEANIKELSVDAQPIGGTYAFTLAAAPLARTLLALGGTNVIEHPAEVLPNAPSNWHQTAHEADLLIVTHATLRQSLEPLRALRESQGLRVVLVDVEDVYDEFNYGARSATALKDFVLRAKSLWQTPPRYLLLVGDATADPRDYQGLGERDYVPALMVDSVHSEAPSDDALADADKDGLAEIAVGRLPVKTAQEATLVVNKILAYEQYPAGDTLQRGALMVSDRPDDYDFVAFTNQVRQSLPAAMSVAYVNRADADTATIRGRIMTGINQGPGIVNYLGHGSVGVWTGDALLSVADAPQMTNASRLNIFVMMTCLNGSFTEVNTDSLGEAIIKAPNGGGVAVWASSGLTVPYGQVAISKRFYELLFMGEASRFGDAAKAAKAATPDPDVRRLSIFFGDPSMRFR